MKLRRVFLTVFLTTTQAQLTPQERYNNICPSRNGQVDEINPGYHVKHLCDYQGVPGTIRDHIQSPGDCATLCGEASGCAGSTWVYTTQRCMLSSQPEPAQAFDERLYMQWIEDPLGPYPEGSDPHGVEACDSLDVEAACSVSVGRDVAYKGKALKVFGGAHWRTTTHISVFHDLTLTQCIERCISSTTCNSVIQDRRSNNGPCYLKTQSLPAGRPEYTESIWNSVFITG